MQFCTNCGQKLDEDQKICNQCGNSLEKQNVQENIRTNFYVPIDYSDIKDVIPIGNDIIYSTLFSVNAWTVDPKVGALQGSKIKIYDSHALFIKNGIYYQKYKRGLLEPNFIPWYKLLSIVGPGLLFKEKMTVYTVVLKQHHDYETKHNFEMRLMKFYLEFAPHVISEKRKWKHKKGLKRIEKAYNQIIEGCGENLIEFYKTNENYEEFKKLEDKMEESRPKWAKFLIKSMVKARNASLTKEDIIESLFEKLQNEAARDLDRV